MGEVALTFIYVASPYTDPNPDIRNRRYRQAGHYVAQLISGRKWCYSPIVHCHHLAMTYKFPTDFVFWADYDFTMLNAAASMHILQLEGWEKSHGVASEMAFWKQKHGVTGITMVQWNPGK